MDAYVLKYQSSSHAKRFVHPSWYEICEKQTRDQVINIIKKHLYEPGEYTLSFSVNDGKMLRRKRQNFFSGWITCKNEHVIGGVSPLGMIHFDYDDDTFDAFDFINTYPEINYEHELLNPTAKFIVVDEGFLPSEKEFELMCKKSTERFFAKLKNTVNFPLEIACGYPDVIFEICFDQKPNDALRAKTVKVIEDYAATYNKRHEEGIAYAAAIDDTDIVENKKENAVYIHVDFGSCPIETLASLLKAIGKSDLVIKEITLT